MSNCGHGRKKQRVSNSSISNFRQAAAAHEYPRLVVMGRKTGIGCYGFRVAKFTQFRHFSQQCRSGSLAQTRDRRQDITPLAQVGVVIDQLANLVVDARNLIVQGLHELFDRGSYLRLNSRRFQAHCFLGAHLEQIAAAAHQALKQPFSLRRWLPKWRFLRRAKARNQGCVARIGFRSQQFAAGKSFNLARVNDADAVTVIEQKRRQSIAVSTSRFHTCVDRVRLMFTQPCLNQPKACGRILERMRFNFSAAQQSYLDLVLAYVDSKNVHISSGTPVCNSATLTHAGSSTLHRVLRYRSAFKAKRPGRRSLLRARSPVLKSAPTGRAQRSASRGVEHPGSPGPVQHISFEITSMLARKSRRLPETGTLDRTLKPKS